MAPARTALLIGVGHVPAADGLLEPLDDAVDADLRLMNSALQAARYDVTVLHNAGISQIRARIHETARAVPEGGTLLLYFSGHGVRVGDIDYLVPFDAVTPPDGDWQEPYLDSLLPTAISPWLKSSRAGTVLWAIDACRTELTGGDVPFGNSVDNGPPGGGFAVLMGCKEGERSGYTGEGSFFTRGLAEALGPLTPDRSVEDVFANAAARAKAVAHRQGLTQNARIRYGTNFEDRTKTTEICEGRPLLEAWQEAVRTTPLWERVEPRDGVQRVDDGVQRFKDCLSAFVERSAHTLHLAQSRLPFEDPWADDTYPVRLLCDRLPALLPDGAKLSAVEVAVLVAAPFLREAAWAERLSQAAEFGPGSLERVPGADAHRRHYEQVGDQYARVARKVAECHARERPQDAVAVTMWLVHRWVADRFETDDEAVPAPCADALATALLGGAAPAQDRVAELSGLMRAAAEGIGLDEPLDDSGAPRDVERGPAKVLLPGGYQPLRMRPLAALLRLAGVLSLDVRTFPEVVAEHLAVSDPVLPQEIVGLVSHPDLLSWQPEGTTLHLDVPCPHQAVHAALVEVAHQADQLATQVADLAGTLPEAEACLLSAVPTRVTDRDLRASQRGGQATYEVPLLRFHLAQTEVRELLMGEQLYGGEPHLALRELYQNAMDACRYRQMRWDYLDSAGPQPAPWRGRISITMGEDARGRYVECRDNGVGMSAEQLKYTFTRAGSRFEQSKAFRREQSRWLRHDQKLRLFPNSRFGIGVFSYFMLADEMTIVTRQVSPDGIPAAHALSVEIPSSGSLFRIQRHEGAGDGLPEGGTRVRLYLRADGTADGLSCVGTLRPLVRVSEFELEVRDLAGPGHEWEPGVLQSGVGLDRLEPLEAVPGVLWWVRDKGGVLCDGIATDKAPYGYVLNLTGLHAGQLSVSRKELQAYDRTWEEHNWRAGAVPLAQWPGLSMEWLWELERQNLPVARVLWEEWRGKGVTAARDGGGRHRLDSEGWFHPDRGITTRARHVHDAGHLAPWRTAAMRLEHTHHSASSPRSLLGYPVPEPGDSALRGAKGWWHVCEQAARQGVSVADALRRKRRFRVAHPSEAPPALSPGGFDRAPDAMDIELARVLAGSAQISAVQGNRHVSHGRGSLVLASHRFNEPLGAVVDHYRSWVALHGETLPRVPPHHEDHVCTDDEVEALFLQSTLEFEEKMVPVTRPDQVLRVQRATGRTPTEILRVLSDFAWLGWVPPAADTVRSWADLDETLQQVLTEFAPPAEDGSRTLRWGATVVMAVRWETDLSAASERLALIAAATGLTHERRYTDEDGRFVPSSDTAALVDGLNSVGARLEDGIGYEALARGAKEAPHSFDVARAVAELRAAGARLPDNVDIVAEWSALPLRSRFALSGKEVVHSPEDDPADELTASGLFYTAERLHETLADMWAVAHQGADRFGLVVPPLPEDLASYRPSSHDVAALTEQPYSSFLEQPRVENQLSAAVWKPLTPAALARYTYGLEISPAKAYTLLALLRPLGALVPELTAAALAALPASPLSARDMVALDENQWLSPTNKTFGPLDLVSIAGRLGEPVPRTLARVAPFLPLLPESPPLPAPPDTVPLWQDLAILSVGLDGRLPALTGKVDGRHIARAADATGESEAWATERLRLYATLFDLDLDLDDAS
ncbi:caspase family protein [Streptomyces sp. RK9]|uniref:HD domain-containing protein n=1 Tax=Streptomyces sp. RK9 TaxID=3239284 RepID=UPI00386454A7